MGHVGGQGTWAQGLRDELEVARGSSHGALGAQWRSLDFIFLEL